MYSRSDRNGVSMSLLNDSWRKLRLLFEEEDDDAPAEAAKPAEAAQLPAGGAARRAEARRKRKLDMRERLAAMVQPDGSLKGGRVMFVSLFPFAAYLGERWPITFPKVELMSEAIIRRELDPWDLWAAHDDKGFALVFTDPNLSDADAHARCVRIFDAIREHLLGQVHIARGRFDVDPRLMLRALDEDGEPPFVLEDPVPPGAWIPPATELAARRAYLPPGGGTMAASDRTGGTVHTGTPTDPTAPIDWTPAAERAPRDVAVGRSDDRADRDVAVGRSHDKAARDPEWIYATPEQQRASIAAWDGTYEAAEEFDAGRARDQRISELVMRYGENEEQAVARYVTMGRFNTMFDAIDVRFRGFWAPRHQAITTYLADARLRADDLDMDHAALAARAEEISATAALDIAVLARTLDAVVPRLEAGARFFFALPVAFPTLLRRADRHAYFDRWAALPEALRRFGRFSCYQSIGEIGDAALADVVGMLTRAGRTPMFRGPATPASLDRARSLRIKALRLDAGGLGDTATYEALRGLAAIARRYGIVTLFERVPPTARRRALETEATLIEAALLPGPDALPNRPAVLAPEAFAAG